MREVRPSKIGQSAANGLPPLQRFFEVVLFRPQATEMETASRHLLHASTEHRERNEDLI